MPSHHNTILCRYHYDPLDRLIGWKPSEQVELQRFYCKSRLATEIQGLAQCSVLQQGDLLLAQQQHQGDTVETTLLATDQQRSVLHTVGEHPNPPIAYSPYGHHRAESGLTSLLRFNGERPDSITGHYLLGNGYRAFNPVLMRFNSPDSLSPFGKGGLNAYAYCLGDPVNGSDPTGNIPGFSWTTRQLHIMSKATKRAGLPIFPEARKNFSHSKYSEHLKNPLSKASQLLLEWRAPSRPAPNFPANSNRKFNPKTLQELSVDRLEGKYIVSANKAERKVIENFDPPNSTLMGKYYKFKKAEFGTPEYKEAFFSVKKEPEFFDLEGYNLGHSTVMSEMKDVFEMAAINNRAITPDGIRSMRWRYDGTHARNLGNLRYMSSIRRQ